MATKYTSQVSIKGHSGRKYRGYVSATVSNVDNDTSRITWSAQVQMYNAAQYGVGVQCSVNGSVKGTKTGYLSKSPGTTFKTVATTSGHTDFTRGTSAKNVTVTVKAYGTTVSGYGSAGGSASASVTVTIPALPSYTVSYNANGGSGAPGAQTKWYGKTLTMSSVKPTRTGYTFLGWGTSTSSESVSKNPGSSYTANASEVYYAIWKANTFTVSYDANGGSDAPEDQTKTYGVTLTLTSDKPTKTNYNFLGWSTDPGGTTAQYIAGGDYTDNVATTLYAVWQLAYIAPRITNFKADRCDSKGTLEETGQYALVTFSWETDKTVSSIKIVCNDAETVVQGSGMSGSVSEIVGANALSTESQHSITVTVADDTGSSSSTRTLAPLAYIIDFSPKGGVAIGEPAQDAKRFDVAVPMYLQSVNRPMPLKNANDHWGMCVPDGTDADWIRTTQNGIIPHLSNADEGDGSLGMPSWPFNSVYAVDHHVSGHIYMKDVPFLGVNADDQVELDWTTGGLRGRVMKKLWEGTWSTGEITVSEAPYYNVFMIKTASSVSGILAMRTPGNESNSNWTYIRGCAPQLTENAGSYWWCVNIAAKGTTFGQDSAVAASGHATIAYRTGYYKNGTTFVADPASISTIWGVC